MQAASIYSIQPLIDASQPSATFNISFNTIGFRQVSNTNSPYLVGRVNDSLALGSFDNGSFGFRILPPLATFDRAGAVAPLADGSVIGISFRTNSPGSISLTRWVNGSPSEIQLSDSNNSGANFGLSILAANSVGDIAGQYTLNGQTSIYLYNIYSADLQVLPVPDSGASQQVVLGLTDNRKILALNQTSAGQYKLYDPLTQDWTTIGLGPGATNIRGNGYLAENGSFAADQFLPDGTGLPVAYNAGSYLPLLNPNVFVGFGGTLVFGYNSAGTAVGIQNNVSGLWENGQFIDITNQILNPAGWGSFAFQTGGAWLGTIDEAGRIYGMGTYNGTETAFMLSPVNEVPEPATLWLVATTIGWLAARKIRARTN